MSTGGGYRRYSDKGKVSLKGYLMGINTKWYTKAGWEYGYLWGKDPIVRPITLGDAFNEYSIFANSKSAIIRFLKEKANQPIHVSAMGQRYGGLNATFVHLEVPPTTLMRQGLLAAGSGFVGMGGEVFSDIKELFDIGDGLSKASGKSISERLGDMSQTSSYQYKVGLSIRIGTGKRKGAKRWADISLMNGKTSFGIIAARLENLPVEKQSAEAAIPELANQVAAVGNAVQPVGGFI